MNVSPWVFPAREKMQLLAGFHFDLIWYDFDLIYLKQVVEHQSVSFTTLVDLDQFLPHVPQVCMLNEIISNAGEQEGSGEV